MTQVELSPYRIPHSPLDLVDVKIIFGRIFEAFWQMSQAAVVGVVPAANDKPVHKKPSWISLKKALSPRYSDILLFWIAACCYYDVFSIVGHPMVLSQLKLLIRNPLAL
jgi:hypothetical protein